MPADARQRVFAGLQQVEDPDVGARDEGRAGADEDDGVGARVCARARNGLVDAVPHRGTERVDRRVVDRQDRHAVRDFVANQFGH